MTRFEELGYKAFANGIKDSIKDPGFGMAMLEYDEDDYHIDPHDDWNQGWLRAVYEKKNATGE